MTMDTTITATTSDTQEAQRREAIFWETLGPGHKEKRVDHMTKEEAIQVHETAREITEARMKLEAALKAIDERIEADRRA